MMTRNVPAANSISECETNLLRLVADSVPALMAYYNVHDLRCQFANQRYAQYNGWTVDSILGKTVREVIGEAAWQVIEPHVLAVVRGQTVRYVREQSLPNGDTRMIEVSLIPHFPGTGEQTGAFVLINDITERWQAERAVRESEQRMRKFVHASSEGILFHKNGFITDVNSAMTQLTGYQADELIGQLTTDFVIEEHRQIIQKHIADKDERPYEVTILHKDGHAIAVEVEAKTMPYQGEELRMAVIRDITAHKAAQAKIEFLARHDTLTQLPNRQYLNDYLPMALALAKRQQWGLAFFFIDLDGFKTINDTLGHEVGDQVLIQSAQRLQGLIRESDLVVRLGGDEFLVILTNINQLEQATQTAAALLSTMQIPFTIKDQFLTVYPSIGISLYPEHGSTQDELVRHADHAMYQAKNGGGNRYVVYEKP